MKTWDDDSDDAYLGPDPDITGGAAAWATLAVIFLVICAVVGFVGSLIL